MTPYIVYYNKDMFDKAGIAYPKGDWTWNDFLATAKKLTLKDSRGVVTQFGAVLDGEDILYFVKAWKGSLWNKDKTKCIIDTPEAREGIQFVIDMATKHHVSPDLKNRSDQGGSQAFEGGRAAMLTLCGRWNTVSFRKVKSLRWGVCGLPKGKVKVNPLITHAWVVSSQTKYPEKAYEFVKFMCGEDCVRSMMQMGDCVPPIKKIAETEFLQKNPQYPDEETQPYIDEMKYTYPQKEYLNPKITFSEIGQKVWSKNIDSVLLGKWDVPTYTKTVQKGLNDLLATKK